MAPATPSPTGAPQASFAAAGTNRTRAVDYWAVEDAQERERLPLYQVIPAARPEELTPANGWPKRGTYLTWHRSHGDNGGTRYSASAKSTAKT